MSQADLGIGNYKDRNDFETNLEVLSSLL
jgi:hypothetical protein